jgi:dTDP-4-dehydrorhamnose reductase
VFAGDSPHYETDMPNAKDVYGKSKSMGEHGGIIVRTSFVGLGQRGILNWLMSQKTPVEGYANVLWNGVMVNYAARYIVELSIKKELGLYHLYGPDTSKFGLLMALKEAFKLSVPINRASQPKLDMRLRGRDKFIYIEEDIKEQIKQYRKDYIEYICGNPGGTQ